jgi:hypothetical protein
MRLAFELSSVNYATKFLMIYALKVIPIMCIYLVEN